MQPTDMHMRSDEQLILDPIELLEHGSVVVREQRRLVGSVLGFLRFFLLLRRLEREFLLLRRLEREFGVVGAIVALLRIVDVVGRELGVVGAKRPERLQHVLRHAIERRERVVGRIGAEQYRIRGGIVAIE